jgi:tetratricopeptide (TPR) repeat protein
VKKITVLTLAYLCLAAAAAWSQDAMDFYNRGLQSSLANKRIEYFSKAIQLNPNLAEAYEKRAIHYYYQRKFDNAINDYTKVIEFKPRWVAAYRMRGLAYLKKEQGGWIKGEIDSLRSYFSKQELPNSRESLEKAIQDFSHAIELDPKLANAYSHRAEAYRLRGMIDEALRDCTKAIQLRGDRQSTSNAYATKAMIHRKLGQNELAEADFRKSDELNPRFYVFGFFMPRYFGNTASLESVSRAGLLSIIILAVIVVCGLTLRAPKKETKLD